MLIHNTCCKSKSALITLSKIYLLSAPRVTCCIMPPRCSKRTCSSHQTPSAKRARSFPPTRKWTRTTPTDASSSTEVEHLPTTFLTWQNIPGIIRQVVNEMNSLYPPAATPNRYNGYITVNSGSEPTSSSTTCTTTTTTSGGVSSSSETSTNVTTAISSGVTSTSISVPTVPNVHPARNTYYSPSRYGNLS